MSGSISSKDRYYHGDRSVGSCRSSWSSSGGRRKSKRFVIETSSQDSALYLPNNLIPNHHRVSALDCDRSLQELDDTVASASKYYSSELSLDNGERSPTSVSYDIATTISYAKEAEQVLRHLTRPDFRRHRSSSERSTASMRSKSSRSSRSSRGSKGARKKRNDLEKKIFETVLSATSETTDSAFTTKECSDSACRSAQFILTDLFHEASKSMNESAVPHPPFCNSTSWSHLPTGDLLNERPQKTTRAKSLSALPPRHPECQIYDEEFLPPKITKHISEESKTVADAHHSKVIPRPTKSSSPAHDCFKVDPPAEDPFADLDVVPKTRRLGDIIREADAESESSSVYGFAANEQQETHLALKRDNTISATSDCTGTLEFSMDDSMLLFSSTYGTSIISHFEGSHPSPHADQSVSKPSKENMTKKVEQPNVVDMGEDTCWTRFDESPFQASSPTENAFGAFSPFEDDGDGEQWLTAEEKPDSPAAMDSAWDTSRVIPTSSPNSPASVFNFFE